MPKMKVEKQALVVKHAISKDPCRLVLNCVHITPTEVVATDGTILARIKNHGDQPEDAEGEVLLCPSILKFAEKMFGNGSYNRPITLEMVDGKLRIEGYEASGEVTLTSQPVEGKFPNWEEVVPKETTERFTLGLKQLEQAVKIAKAAGAEALTFKQQEENPHKAMELVALPAVSCSELSIIMMPQRRSSY